MKHWARKWQDVFIQTCELLVKKDSTIFHSFVNDNSMQGRTRVYFSTTANNIKNNPKRIAGMNVFVETNFTANSVRNIIVSMLEKYNMPKNQKEMFISNRTMEDMTFLRNEELM